MNVPESTSDPTSTSLLTPEQYASMFAKRPQMAPAILRRALADNSPTFPNIVEGLEMLMKGEDASDKLKIYEHKISDVAMKLASDKTLYQSRELRTALGFRVSCCISSKNNRSY